MKNLAENLKKIYLEEKGLIAMMAVVVILAIGLLVFSLVNLKFDSSVIKVGYGDIGRYQGGDWSSMSNSGGYRDGAWSFMLAFPLLALVFGILHNFLAVKLFEKKGGGVARVMLIFTICLILATFVVEIRLLGEG
ncbi:MAG: hypothetical protein Q4E47_02455 [Candidatus Saccharibacteria bacterium]|nr:hypothetical protein [Candidatus Saccharibacteria bacterium]